MKRGQFLYAGIFIAFTLSVCASTPPSAAQVRSKPAVGTISGTVRDAAGIAQLGATVEVASETPGDLLVHQLLTNTQGLFRAENLSPGFYTIRVTLAGYLPGIERHIHISSNLTTVVKIELESLYASIEQLRRLPANGTVEPDDWKWVLRSASGLRPVLQWHEEDTEDGSAVVGDVPRRPLGQVEVTSGARRPGSVSNIDGAPATAFAYDQRIDGADHLVFAGQASYDEDTPGGGLAAMWLPTGSLENGLRSTMVLREAKIGPEGAIFRGVRLDQSGTMTLGDRFLLRVGGEYVLVGAGASASALRPRVKWETQVAPNWYVEAIYAALPINVGEADSAFSELLGKAPVSPLSSALEQLDSFPALMWRHGRPVLENGTHQELAVEHKLGSDGVLQIAAFHDDNTHVAVFGRGQNMPALDYFQDSYSKGFAYDGGSSVSWGSRAALREKLSDDIELTVIYAFSGALVPVGGASDGPLREALRTAPRESAALKITGRVPRTGTKVTAGYKWIGGTALSRVDPYSEGIFDVSPYLHVGVRQPVPWTLGHLEATADCDNLLAQGYVPMNTRDGQVLLVPAFRSLRGGLSLQF